MENEFTQKIGDEVEVLGGFSGTIVGRLVWETSAHPLPTKYYEIRSGDKTITVAESELVELF